MEARLFITLDEDPIACLVAHFHLIDAGVDIPALAKMLRSLPAPARARARPIAPLIPAASRVERAVFHRQQRVGGSLSPHNLANSLHGRRTGLAISQAVQSQHQSRHPLNGDRLYHAGPRMS